MNDMIGSSKIESWFVDCSLKFNVVCTIILLFWKKLHPLGEVFECDFFALKYLIIEQFGLLSNLVWNYWGFHITTVVRNRKPRFGFLFLSTYLLCRLVLYVLKVTTGVR